MLKTLFFSFSCHWRRTADPVPAPQSTGVVSVWRGATAASTCLMAAPRWPPRGTANSSRTCWQACARREPSRSKMSSSILMARTRWGLDCFAHSTTYSWHSEGLFSRKWLQSHFSHSNKRKVILFLSKICRHVFTFNIKPLFDFFRLSLCFLRRP